MPVLSRPGYARATGLVIAAIALFGACGDGSDSPAPIAVEASESAAPVAPTAPPDTQPEVEPEVAAPAPPTPQPVAVSPTAVSPTAVETADASPTSPPLPTATSVPDPVDDATAESAAATNLSQLQPADLVLDYEVLDVADGSIATLREAVDGDRPVLLWFFSPH